MIEVIHTINEPIEVILKSTVDFLSGSETVESQQIAIPDGVTTITVGLIITQPDLNYSISKSWFNDIDISPAFQPIIITNKGLNSFDFTWNSSTDTANYKIDYTIHRHNP